MRVLLLICLFAVTALPQPVPAIEPGVSQELAKWRTARYSDVRYKLNLTLEKMSPVLKGTIEIRVTIGARTPSSGSPQSGEMTPIILDWRKIKGHEERSAVSNVTVNGKLAALAPSRDADKSVRVPFEERDEHLIFRDGVVLGENVIKLDFTSPILTSGSAITRCATPLKIKDKFDIVTRLLILNDPDAPKLLADLERTETSDDAKRYAYAARAGIATAENKAKYWDDLVNNKTISESWIEAAFGPWNSLRHSELTLPYLERALKELPNHKRSRKIFFVNGWLGAFIGGQRDQEALDIINKFLADNPTLDNDLRLKILENVDLIERAVKIRNKYKN